MNTSLNYKPLNTALPLQQVPLSIKLKNPDKYGNTDFMKDSLDAIEAIGRYYYYSNLPLRDNYKIVSKEFDIKHYMDTNQYYDITSAIAQEFEIPYHLKHYDIIGKGVSLLVGEFLKRPDTFSVRCEDSEADNEFLRTQTDLMQSFLQQEVSAGIMQRMLQQGIDPNRNEFKNEEEQSQYQQQVQAKYQELTPENIDKFMKYDYRSAAEHWGQAQLSNDKKRFNLRELEKIEFTDMLIADRCFSHVFLTSTGYCIEPWNPVNTFFHVSPENRYAEDGDYAGRTVYLTKTECIERYGWRMHKGQIEELYPEYYHSDTTRGNIYKEAVSATLVPFPGYRDYQQITNAFGFDIFNSNAPLGLFPEYLGQDQLGYPSYQFTTGDIVQVTEAYWKSQRKIGKLYIENPETGVPEKHIVDETFDPKLFGIEELEQPWGSLMNEDEQEVGTIIWTWTTQIWQGVKIFANNRKETINENKDRNAIYVDVRPCPFQFKGDFTEFNPKLPVIGGVFNNRNAKSNSFVDLLKPYQIAYNIFSNLAVGVAQMNNGKFLLMNMRLLPKTKDWGGEEALDKVMSIARELKIVPMDDSNSNIGMGTGQPYPGTIIDLDETERIARLLNFANIFEENGFRQVGINQQRQGQTQASETAQGVQIAVSNSYAITEPYFENFYNYKKRKLQALLDIAQYCASKTKGDITQTYTTSDLGRAFIKITGTELFLRNMGVNIDNASDTAEQLKMAQELIIKNNQTGVPLSGLLSVISLKSMADIKKSVESLEEKAAREVQAQREHEKELQTQALEAKQAEIDKQNAFEAQQNQLDRENKLQLAELQGIANEGSYGEGDTTGLLIEQTKLGLQKSKDSNDIAIKQQQATNQLIDSFNKRKSEKEKQTAENKRKDKEAKSKERVEDQKIEAIDRQSSNQEKMQNKKIEGDLKLVKEKSKAEREKAELAKELIDKKIEMEGAKVEAAKKKQVEEVKQIINKTTIEKKIGDNKVKTEEKISDAKVDQIETLTDVKKDEAKQLSKIKIQGAKDKAKDDKVVNKEKTKIKLQVSKIKGKRSIADAKKPPKKPK